MKNKIDLTNIKIIFLTASLCCFLWGSATPAIKMGYRLFRIDSSDIASILLFAGIRFLLAGLLVIAWHSISKRHVILPPKGSGTAIISLALSQCLFQYIFYYVGVSRASGVHSTIISGTNVFFSMLCASLIFRYEKLDIQKNIGCILGFLGIAIVSLAGSGTEKLLTVSFFGEGFVLLAQIFYALSGSLVKNFSKNFDVATLCGYQFMTGGLALIVVGAACGGSLSREASLGAYILLLYMGFLSAIAYTLWGILLKYNPVSRVSIFGFMSPIFGVILSAIFLGESSQALNRNTLTALILVCLGIYVVNKEKRK